MATLIMCQLFAANLHSSYIELTWHGYKSNWKTFNNPGLSNILSDHLFLLYGNTRHCPIKALCLSLRLSKI